MHGDEKQIGLERTDEAIFSMNSYVGVMGAEEKGR